VKCDVGAISTGECWKNGIKGIKGIEGIKGIDGRVEYKFKF